MLSRRTLASLTAVAALAGGTAGGVTSSFTAPEGASAAPGTTPSIGKVLSTKVVTVNSAVLREALRTDSDRIKAIEKSVAALNAKVDAVHAQAANTDRGLEGLTGMIARDAQGHSLIQIVGDIQHKSRLICAETVPVEVLGISGHDPNCN